MRAEQRGAGLKERVRETWPDTERTKTMTTGLTRFTQRSHTGEDSNWEPDGVTHHVRFCEGPGVTVGWLRSCGTAGKPGGNREDKHQPVPLGEPGLLTKSWPCSNRRRVNGSIRDCRKSPNVAILENSHIVKSTTYVSEKTRFKVFRQSLRYLVIKSQR
jgi:hypothetical protein